jgi:hypothetical protein
LISGKESTIYRIPPSLDEDAINVVVEENKDKQEVALYKDVTVTVCFKNLKKRESAKPIRLVTTKYNSSSFKALYPKTEILRLFLVDLDNCDPQAKKLSISHGFANGKIFVRNPTVELWFALPGQTENGGKVERIPVSTGLFCIVKMREFIPNLLYHTQERILKEIEGPKMASGTKSLYFHVPPACENWEIGWHGTRVENIQSILRSGLLAPATITNSGFIVKIPPGHIPKGILVDDVPDFPTAVFMSPYLSYASHAVYSQPFTCDFGSGKKGYVPVLECRVKPKEFTYHKSTTPSFEISTEDDSKMEMRAPNPANVVIYAVHFIPK